MVVAVVFELVVAVRRVVGFDLEAVLVVDLLLQDMIVVVELVVVVRPVVEFDLTAVLVVVRPVVEFDLMAASVVDLRAVAVRMACFQILAYL